MWVCRTHPPFGLAKWTQLSCLFVKILESEYCNRANSGCFMVGIPQAYPTQVRKGQYFLTFLERLMLGVNFRREIGRPSRMFDKFWWFWDLPGQFWSAKHFWSEAHPLTNFCIHSDMRGFSIGIQACLEISLTSQISCPFRQSTHAVTYR